MTRWDDERVSSMPKMTHDSELDPGDLKARSGLAPYHSALERIGATHRAASQQLAKRAKNDN